ncbi:MAG: transketolase [Acidimicrobiales bacterium]
MGYLNDDERERLERKALFVRLETLRLTRIAGAGHYSGTFSAAELLSTLYYRELRLDPANPQWPDRDRFVLSKGHAAIGLYPILAELGFFDVAELETYTRLGSAFGDHPDMRKVRGIDFSSGSLGHGLSIGVGMALGARVQSRAFRTFVMVGDAELNEGQVWEAAMSAGHFKLNSLICIVDRNQLGIDGRTEDVMSVEPIGDRFASFGWDVQRIDGHDVDEIAAAFDNTKDRSGTKPHVIIADTVKGKGVERMELNLNWHVGNLNEEDYNDVYAELVAGGPQ